MKLKDIAERIGARPEPADADLEITGIAPIESAGPGTITFIADRRYAAAARSTRASAIILDQKFPAPGKPVLRSANPQFAYARTAELFYQSPQYAPGVHSTA